jgi:hypothetical protein
MRFLLVLITLFNRTSSTEEDGAVASIISVTSGREASIVRALLARQRFSATLYTD